MCTLQKPFLQYICLAVGTWKWRGGLPSRRYIFFLQIYYQNPQYQWGRHKEWCDAKGTLNSWGKERIVFQISLKGSRNVRKYMTHKTKAIILKGKISSQQDADSKFLLILYFEVLCTVFNGALCDIQGRKYWPKL